MTFRAGEDQFYGGSVTDRARMGGGADYFTGGGGQDRGWGEGGDDWLKGDAGNDLLDGGTGTDSVEGGAGRDTLWGGDGNDSVWGGGGADRLEGGTGTDHLWGAAGADVFRFGSTGKAADVIHDFEAGIDTVAVARGRIGGALGAGDLAGARFHADAPVGTRGQFVLHDEGRNDRLVWDANGTTSGGVVQIAVLSGESGLTAGDILIY